MFNTFSIIALLLAATTFALPAIADSSNGKSKNKGSAHQEHQGSERSGGRIEERGNDSLPGSLVTAGISFAMARELAVNHQYTGHQPLPPGIRKNLARGKPLPPGIAKRSLSGPMLAGLPHYEGYEWQQHGTDLVLVSIASAVIADVLVDVFR